jgi:hypothetical protein
MPENQLNRLTILCGAGASYGCGARAPHPKAGFPPLAKDLFATEFENVLGFYQRVMSRTDEIRSRLANGQNIEAILRDLYQSAEQYSNYWCFQIPLYLRHLFWSISQDYGPRTSKFDTLTRCAIESRFDKVMFVSLNYDLFLDSSLEVYASRVFTTLDSYISASNKWLLIKPHGSVNWAKEIDNCPRDDYNHYPTRMEAPPHFPDGAPIHLILWNRHHMHWYVPNVARDSIPEGYLYPQLVTPADKPKEFVCPQAHTERAIQFFKECRNFMLIGFSGHDDDINSLLDLMPGGSRVMIVGSGRGDANRIYKRISLTAPSLKPKKVQPFYYDDGFANFVESKDFRTFMAGK